MVILVTGVFGFLGYSLSNELAKDNCVIGLYNTSIRSLKNTSIKYYRKIDEITEVPDLIIMCHAAVSSGNVNIENNHLFETNVLFTEIITKYFPNVRTIYISSVSVFGSCVSCLFSEYTVEHPESSYAISKFWAEKLVLANKQNVVVRMASLYGIGMKENTLIPNYVNQALESKVINVWGDGERLQNYIHITDAVDLIKKIISKELDSYEDSLFLGVSTQEYSNKIIAQTIAKFTGSKIKFVLEDKSTSFRYNNQNTRDKLNWSPKMKINEGIQEYIEWKKKQL